MKQEKMAGQEVKVLQASAPFEADAVVVAKGELRQVAEIDRLIQGAKLVLLCDGALHSYKPLYSRRPDVVIGDGDSVEAEELKELGMHFVQIPEQETNDLTKAVTYALQQGAQKIAIIAAEGGRLDHTIGNTFLLAEYYQMGAEVRMISEEGVMLPFRGKLRIEMEAGQPLSFFALTSEPMSASGVAYPFTQRSFTALWQATLNRSVAEVVEVESGGMALLYLPVHQPERCTITLESEAKLAEQDVHSIERDPKPSEIEEPKSFIGEPIAEEEPRFKKLYLVWKGHKPGIYQTWKECQEQTRGFSAPLFESVKDVTRSEAERLYHAHHYAQLYTSEILPDAIAVDASAKGNPGPMEYRGVWVENKEVLFASKVYPEGTNNIGEYLALVHLLALMKQKGINHPIYSDSTTAIGWVRKKQCQTKLTPNETNRELLDVIQRATAWLQSNDISQYHIYKWNTDEWGEIPADYGRK